MGLSFCEVSYIRGCLCVEANGLVSIGPRKMSFKVYIDVFSSEVSVNRRSTIQSTLIYADI